MGINVLDWELRKTDCDKAGCFWRFWLSLFSWMQAALISSIDKPLHWAVGWNVMVAYNLFLDCSESILTYFTSISSFHITMLFWKDILDIYGGIRGGNYQCWFLQSTQAKYQVLKSKTGHQDDLKLTGVIVTGRSLKIFTSTQTQLPRHA